MTPEFRKAVAETPDGEWTELSGGDVAQQWAEVEFVPSWTAYSKKDPYYRFLAVREPMHRPPLPGMEVEVGQSVQIRRYTGERLVQGVGGGDQPYHCWGGVDQVVLGALRQGRAGTWSSQDRPCRWAVALGTVRGQCRLVVHRNPGIQPDLGGQAVGDGRRVAEQAAQGSPIRRRQPARADGAPQQTADHTSDRRPPVLRPAYRDAPEHICSGRRPLSLGPRTLAVSRRRLSIVALAWHVHLGPSAVSNGAKTPP